MLELWLPLLQAAGDLDALFATPQTIAELETMSPSKIDRYLASARRAMQLREIATTPSPLLRNTTGWTENASIRNKASQWIVGAVSDLQSMFPFGLHVFDSDNGSDLTCRINQIQLDLTELSQAKTEGMIASRYLDMAPLKASIPRLQTTE